MPAPESNIPCMKCVKYGNTPQSERQLLVRIGELETALKQTTYEGGSRAVVIATKALAGN